MILLTSRRQWGEPVQDIAIAGATLQQGAGRDQIQRTTVTGQVQGTTQFVPGGFQVQVRTKAAEQHQVRGRERLGVKPRAVLRAVRDLVASVGE